MRLRYRDIKKFIYLLGVLSFLVCVHVASIYVFAVHKFSVSYDALLTVQATTDIQRYLKDTDIHRLPPHQCAQELQTKFACIQSVTCRYKPNGTVEIGLKAYAPFVRLDDDRLVTVQNAIVPVDYYIPESVEQLPTVQIVLQDDEYQLPCEVFSYLQQLDTAWLKGATIAWRHRNEIHLALTDPNLQLLCNEQVVPNQQLLDHCIAIAHEKAKQTAPAHRMLADVRFADQIIVSNIKG